MTCPAVTWVEDGKISDNADPTVDDHAQAAKENSSEAVPVTTWQDFHERVGRSKQPSEFGLSLVDGIIKY